MECPATSCRVQSVGGRDGQVVVVGDGEADAAGELAEPGRRPGPDAVYARNWKTVLAVDASMGVAVVVAGLFLAVVWNPIGGGFLGSLGAVYVFLVAKRAATWAAWRRDVGL